MEGERQKQCRPGTGQCPTHFSQATSETRLFRRTLTCSQYRSTKIGQALADLGFEQIRRENGRFWKVAERPQVDIDNRISDVDHSENVETDAPF